jgi:uncharacterized membrane protein YgcG
VFEARLPATVLQPVRPAFLLLRPACVLMMFGGYIPRCALSALILMVFFGSRWPVRTNTDQELVSIRRRLLAAWRRQH